VNNYFNYNIFDDSYFDEWTMNLADYYRY